ncbi:hypothetical protein Nepgr_030037 [Nepenthes gracilis]|uniref:Uncharacterized protein n=1 Tax=Nepenthes gracilis TaxID=150966 RepID=A0AAD3TFG3_NEPGR|nr:hypothetical protein Nepgr_030037 [Nepenthes gracilis]
MVATVLLGAAVLPREFDMVWLVCPACIKWWLVALHVFDGVDKGWCCWTWCSALGSAVAAVPLVAASYSDAAEAGAAAFFFDLCWS